MNNKIPPLLACVTAIFLSATVHADNLLLNGSFAEQQNSMPEKLEAVLANEDVLRPGEYPVKFQVVGPDGERVFDRDAMVQIPAQKKGTGTFCRNGPKGASHKRVLTPFSQSLTRTSISKAASGRRSQLREPSRMATFGVSHPSRIPSSARTVSSCFTTSAA